MTMLITQGQRKLFNFMLNVSYTCSVNVVVKMKVGYSCYSNVNIPEFLLKMISRIHF